MRRRRRVETSASSALDRFSEPFPPHGALAAEGAANLLGRPRLDPLVVLVREAVQNSWDARRAADGPIGFGLQLRELAADPMARLRNDVFSDVPPAAHQLREVLSRPHLSLLSLTDTGTVGLGGPVRADQPAPAGQPSNFVDLLFNIGQPAEREFSGGAYGFGRTISFVTSEARAVLIYSRTHVRRRRESRFISAAFSDHFSDGRRRFTGRHWWGRSVEGSIEPLAGEEADRAARSVGLDVFDRDQSGTTISVVAPDLRGRTPSQACNFLAGALVWNFWPKMLDDGRGPAIEFSVALDDVGIRVPHPEELPPLPAFVASLRALRAADAPDADRREALDRDGLPETVVDAVVLPRTGERIGRLALTRTAILPRPVTDEGTSEADERGPSSSFEGLAHHVALMREPELVVQYVATAELASGSSEYGGVFKSERTVDRAFSRAEPPTHDAWHPELVPETKLRRFVAVALRTIRERTDRYAEQIGSHRGGPDVAPLARALDLLFVERKAIAGSPLKRLPDAVVGEVSIERVGEHVVSTVAFVVEHAPGSVGSTVEAKAHVATHDGWTAERERDGDPDRPPVVVLGFQSGDTNIRATQLRVGADDSGMWSLQVRSSPHVAVAVDLVARVIETEA
jgi:hypothetical protein